MADSTIEWTDATWNPVAGCQIVSPGCTNCYAMRMAARLANIGQEKYQGLTRQSGGRHVWNGKITCDEASLAIPSQWRKPRLVFVNSMSDLFHDSVPVAFINRVWTTMEKANRHTFQILTKRPDRMRRVTEHLTLLPNVWLGTSVETTDYLWRLQELQATPAAIRFISFEPLLGPIYRADLTDIHWAIVGGESGPKARPMDEEWVRALKGQCEQQNVAFFFKQWGGTNKKRAGRKLDGRTWNAMPLASSTP